MVATTARIASAIVAHSQLMADLLCWSAVVWKSGTSSSIRVRSLFYLGPDLAGTKLIGLALFGLGSAPNGSLSGMP